MAFFVVIFHPRKRLILKWNVNLILYQVMRNSQKVMWTTNYVSAHKHFKKCWFLQSILCPGSLLQLGHASSQDSQMSHPPLNLSLAIVYSILLLKTWQLWAESQYHITSWHCWFLFSYLYVFLCCFYPFSWFYFKVFYVAHSCRGLNTLVSWILSMNLKF